MTNVRSQVLGGVIIDEIKARGRRRVVVGLDDIVASANAAAKPSNIFGRQGQIATSDRFHLVNVSIAVVIAASTPTATVSNTNKVSCSNRWRRWLSNDFHQRRSRRWLLDGDWSTLRTDIHHLERACRDTAALCSSRDSDRLNLGTNLQGALVAGTTQCWRAISSDHPGIVFCGRRRRHGRVGIPTNPIRRGRVGCVPSIRTAGIQLGDEASFVVRGQ